MGNELEQWIFNRVENGKGKVFEDRYTYFEKLKKRGFVRIGVGMYSWVVAHPKSNKVIKLGRGDAWIDYIFWAHKTGYGGNFAPRVYSYRQHKNFYVAIMERLDKRACDLEMYEDLALVHRLFGTGVEYKNKLALTLVDLVIPGLGKFAADFQRAFPKGRDLHGGNFMLRSDKSFVLIDPLTGDSNIKSTRLKAKDLLPLANDNQEVACAA